jgi:transposase
MGSKIDTQSDEAEKAVRDIRRATRRHFSAEDKVRIVIAGLRGEDSVAELYRKEGINQNLYYRWSKEFLEAGKKRLAGHTAREATSDEVKGLRAQARQLKELMAELMLENRLLKKACWRMGSPIPEVRGGGEAGDYPAGRAVVVAGAPYPGQLGIPHSTCYGWYDRYRSNDADSLADRRRGAGVEQAPGCRHPGARARAQGAAAVTA